MRFSGFNYLLLFCLCWLPNALAFGETLTFVKHNSKPKYLEDSTGLCDQIYSVLAEQLKPYGIELLVDPTLYPAKRLLSMVENGEADGFCGLERTPDREKTFTYISPSLYTVSYLLLAHESESFIPTSVDDIIRHNSVVGTFYGTNSSRWLKGHAGLLVNDNFDSLDAAIKLVGMKKLRYFYYHDLALNYYSNDSQFEVKTLPTRLQHKPHWLVLNKSLSDKTTQDLTSALAELYKSGQIKNIYDSFLVE
ncbi:substrate-binding periplasmic protein [Reinekea sp.]|jgi:ABC-type amino acid transport substrate-binding protein